MYELYKWSKDNLKQMWDRGLATVLVFIAILIFTGVLPSPLTNLEAYSVRHSADMASLLVESRAQTLLLVDQCVDRKVKDRVDPGSCFEVMKTARQAGEAPLGVALQSGPVISSLNRMELTARD